MPSAWGFTPGSSVTDAGTLPAISAGFNTYASPYAFARIGTQAYLFSVNPDDTTLEAYTITNTNPLGFTLVDSEVFDIPGLGTRGASNAVTVGSTIYVMVGNWSSGTGFLGKIFTFDGTSIAGPLTALPDSHGAFVGTDGTDIYIASINDSGEQESLCWRYNAGTWDNLTFSGSVISKWSVSAVTQIGSECVFFGTSVDELGSGTTVTAFKVSGTTPTSLGLGGEYSGSTAGVDPIVYYVTGALSFNSKGYCIFHDWGGTPPKDYVWEVDPAVGSASWAAVEDFAQEPSGDVTRAAVLFSYDGSIYTPLQQLSPGIGVDVYRSPGTTVTDPWTEVGSTDDESEVGLGGLVLY